MVAHKAACNTLSKAFLARLDEVQEELLYYPRVGVGVGVGGGVGVCRVPKCPTALNVRQILFFSKSVILVTKININSKISKYFKKIISEKYSESNLEKNLPDI